MNKVKFEEALEIGWNIHKVFEAVHEKNNIKIGKYYVKALIIIQTQYDGEVSVKKIREDFIKNHQSIDENKLEIKLSKVIKYLVDNEYIEKKSSNIDQRIKIIKLTKKSTYLLSQYKNLAKKIWEDKYYD